MKYTVSSTSGSGWVMSISKGTFVFIKSSCKSDNTNGVVLFIVSVLSLHYLRYMSSTISRINHYSALNFTWLKFAQEQGIVRYL